MSKKLSNDSPYFDFIDTEILELYQEFVELARSVYITNDKRCEVKKLINLMTSSGLVEEKSYKKYL